MLPGQTNLDLLINEHGHGWSWFVDDEGNMYCGVCGQEIASSYELDELLPEEKDERV